MEEIKGCQRQSRGNNLALSATLLDGMDRNSFCFLICLLFWVIKVKLLFVSKNTHSHFVMLKLLTRIHEAVKNVLKVNQKEPFFHCGKQNWALVIIA